MELKNFNLTYNNLDYLFDSIRALDLSKGYVCNVTIKTHVRTLDQNARLWKLYGAIGDYIGETPDRVHELMGWKFLREQKTVNGETIESIKSTTKLDTSAMVYYQKMIELWASEIGFIFEQDNE